MFLTAFSCSYVVLVHIQYSVSIATYFTMSHTHIRAFFVCPHGLPYKHRTWSKTTGEQFLDVYATVYSTCTVPRAQYGKCSPEDAKCLALLVSLSCACYFCYSCYCDTYLFSSHTKMFLGCMFRVFLMLKFMLVLSVQ